MFSIKGTYNQSLRQPALTTHFCSNMNQSGPPLWPLKSADKHMQVEAEYFTAQEQTEFHAAICSTITGSASSGAVRHCKHWRLWDKLREQPLPPLRARHYAISAYVGVEVFRR